MLHLTCFIGFSVLVALLRGVTMLRLVDLKVPPYTIRGQPVRLECHYDLQGEALYSVKWFKNNQEFFRFLPEDDPPAQVFTQQGVYVDLPSSSDTAVLLRAVDANSTGEYRCEVSGEAPSFKTVTNQKPMVVVDLPDASGPQIEGVRPRYHIGDLVHVNCTSSRSRPAAKLSWYINQEPAEEIFLQHYPILLDDDGLQTSLLGLEFRVRQKHFKKGDLKLKCLATIDTLYWRSNEQSVEGDRPQKAPVLESRETFPPGSSSGTSFKLISSKTTDDHTKLFKVAALFLLLLQYSGTFQTFGNILFASLANFAHRPIQSMMKLSTRFHSCFSISPNINSKVGYSQIYVYMFCSISALILIFKVLRTNVGDVDSKNKYSINYFNMAEPVSKLNAEDQRFST